nr:AbgT family transporter [Erythrobacter sp.]
FPLILIFCQRWNKDFGLGSLAANMLPFSIGLMVAGLVLTIGWVVLDLPLGPGASVFMEIPTPENTAAVQPAN